MNNLLKNKIIVLCALYYALMAVLAPGFFSANNTLNLLAGFLPLLVVSLGQTLVMLTGGIDLSVAAIVGLVSVVGGFLLSTDFTPINSEPTRIVVAVILMLLSGSIVGLINGLSVYKFKMPPFMVTLTTWMLVGGAAIWWTRSANVYNFPEAFVSFPHHFIVGIPAPLLITIPLIIPLFIMLYRTPIGRWIYAIGTNPDTSRVSGVNIGITLILVYTLCGFCAGFTSILYTARLETGSPVMGQGILLDVVGAVVIGGTSLFGGRGRLEWTIGGAFFMTMLDNSLNLMSWSYFIIMIIKGLIIMIAAFYNSQGIKKLSHLILRSN